jgi:diguanylate cyclase (GGDEF)-like protein
MIGLLLQQRTTNLAQAQEQLQVRANNLAQDLNDKVAGTAQLLFGLGRVPLIASPDTRRCSDFLAEVLTAHPQYTGLLTIRPDGALHCDSLRSGRHLQLQDRQYFQQALRSQSIVVEPAIGRLTGKAVLQIAYPVRDENGVLKLVLLASLDLDAYAQRVLQGQPHSGTRFHLGNQDGKFSMVYPRQPALDATTQAEFQNWMQQDAGLTQVLAQDTHPLVSAKAELPRSANIDLRLALSIPQTELNTHADQQFRRAVSGLLGTMVFIIVVAALMGEIALRRHSNRIMQAINRIDAGRYDEPVGPPYPGGELGEVMQALDRMAVSLDQQRQQIALHTEVLERQARIDPLTHLANRHMLMERLWQALEQARRNQRITGVLLLDLDRFKTVNDSLGHGQGDELLCEVATRLSQSVREGDTVARLGGDEFVVLLADVGHVEDIRSVAEKILVAMAHPMALGPRMLSVTTSLGIAIFPKDGETPEALLQYADAAMYQAKELGGNALSFFSPEMRQLMLQRLELEVDLHLALERQELFLQYQPVIDAQSGRVISAEALVRWQHPQRGLIPPMEFIPIAEESGLITRIGAWVLQQTCQQAMAWQRAGLTPIPIAVNLSARQFSAPDLEATITEALQSTGCPAHLLQLEITESCIMDRMDLAVNTLRRISALGIHLAIDDFGTGYSSLSQLKRLPVRTLKIDRSFVQDLGQDTSAETLVDAIISLARKLELRTVAEGVETTIQRDFLSRCGCDSYQGYLYSRPCHPDEFVRYVRQNYA